MKFLLSIFSKNMYMSGLYAHSHNKHCIQLKAGALNND